MRKTIDTYQIVLDLWVVFFFDNVNFFLAFLFFAWVYFMPPVSFLKKKTIKKTINAIKNSICFNDLKHNRD